MTSTGPHARTRSLPLAAATGAAVGVLGGMIGLGGAEFRLPLLIDVFGFVALQAVILNKARGVAGGELLIPTMLVAIARDSRDRSFSVLAANKPFLIAMAARVTRPPQAEAALIG